MSYILRPNQIECSNAVLNSLSKNRNGDFVNASCGFGKSLVIADVASKLDAPTLVLQPTKELLLQNFEKMQSYGIEDIAMHSASVGARDHGKITFATIGSIFRNPDAFKHYKYVLVDECHRVSPKDLTGMYGEFFKAVGNPAKVGLTGSPFRMVQKFVNEKKIVNGEEETESFYTSTVVPLNRIANPKGKKDGMGTFIFKGMIYKAEMQDLIEQGYLCQPNYDLSYCKAFDYTNLKMNTTGANFDDAALEMFVTSPERLKSAFQACADYHEMGIRSNLVFCASVGQAKRLNELLQKAGFNSDVLTSEHKPKERTKIIRDFKEGTLDILLNFNILHTGFDSPSTQIVTIARPIISPELWLQAGARVIRKDPFNADKKAYIVDVAGVSRRLGRIETIKMAKEEGGFRDEIVSEVGILSNKPLFKFRIENDKLKNLAK